MERKKESNKKEIHKIWKIKKVRSRKKDTLKNPPSQCPELVERRVPAFAHRARIAPTAPDARRSCRRIRGGGILSGADTDRWRALGDAAKHIDFIIWRAIFEADFLSLEHSYQRFSLFSVLFAFFNWLG